jgi:hypothetical protein
LLLRKLGQEKENNQMKATRFAICTDGVEIVLPSRKESLQNYKWGDVLQYNSDYRNENMYFWDSVEQEWVKIDVQERHSPVPYADYGIIPARFSLLQPQCLLPLNGNYFAWQYQWYETQLVSNCQLSVDQKSIVTWFQRYTATNNQIERQCLDDENKQNSSGDCIINISCPVYPFYCDQYMPNCHCGGMGRGCGEGWKCYYSFGAAAKGEVMIDDRLRPFLQNVTRFSFELHLPVTAQMGIQSLLQEMVKEDLDSGKISPLDVKQKFLASLQESTYLEKIGPAQFTTV